ncbi:MAG: DUF1737 domain-containing protein [Deltaproteobacteria bacterium]|nr:DUF1737 domain-containing protein [Deltaproteobacteria bacterium]
MEERTYKLLCLLDSEELEMEVEEHIEKGWRPQGGVCYAPNWTGTGGNPCFFQAMVKDLD